MRICFNLRVSKYIKYREDMEGEEEGRGKGKRGKRRKEF